MYGLLLAAAAPGAHASDEFAALGKYAAAIREGIRVDLNTSAGPMQVKLGHAPEVRLELDKGGGFVPTEAAVQLNDTAGFTHEKVPQATVKWRF